MCFHQYVDVKRSVKIVLYKLGLICLQFSAINEMDQGLRPNYIIWSKKGSKRETLFRNRAFPGCKRLIKHPESKSNN